MNGLDEKEKLLQQRKKWMEEKELEEKLLGITFKIIFFIY